MTQLKFEISERLKRRFCKDCNIPISIYIEPYFTHRLKLYDEQFNTLEKFEIFKKSLVNYTNEEDYFEDYNKFKDLVIMDIKNSEGYKKFIKDDFNKFAVDNQGLSNRDAYKEHNIGKTLMSIDMVKANFTSMRHYDKTIFKNKETYEDYLSLFTDNPHFINSKYVRQVIFGNNNPKRQTTYQKFLMNKVLEIILTILDISRIESFSHDEIIVNISDVNNNDKERIRTIVSISAENIGIKLSIKEFLLEKVGNTDGYIKRFQNGKHEFQYVDRILLPLAIRKYKGEWIEEFDKVFVQNDMIAKIIQVPDLI